MKKSLLSMMFAAAVLPLLAKTTLYYDVIFARMLSGDEPTLIEKTVGRDTPKGITFTNAIVKASKGSQQTGTDKYGNPVYETIYENVLAYQRTLDLSPLKQPKFARVSFVAFPLGIWNDGAWNKWSSSYTRSCASANSESIRYLCPESGIGDILKYNYLNDTPGEKLRGNSANIEAAAIANGWDNYWPQWLTKEFRIWQECFVNYECKITFVDREADSDGSSYTQLFTNACEGAVTYLKEYNGGVGFCLVSNRFTKTGHSFVEWSVEGSDGETRPDGAEIEANTYSDDVTMKAVWKINQYPFTVAVSNAVGGAVERTVGEKTESVSDKASTVFLDYGTKVGLVAVPADGYGFVCWSDGVKSKARQVDVGADQNEYVALFSSGIKVKFDKNDDNAQGEMDDQDYVSGESAKQLRANAFTYEYHQFKGWATAPDGQVVYKDSASLSFDELSRLADKERVVNLYAVWSEVTVRVTFKAGDGESVNPTYKDVLYGGKYGELPVPTKKDVVESYVTKTYVFDFWAMADGKTKVDADAIVGTVNNHSLYAHWVETSVGKVFAVALRADECAGWQPQQVNLQYGATVPTLPQPVRAGYEFVSWTNATFGALEPGKKSQVTCASEFFASWKVRSYTIGFDQQGGSGGTTKPLTVTYGEAVPDISYLPTKKGYTFLGYTNRLGETVFDLDRKFRLGEVWSCDEDITVYARWKTSGKPKQIKVTFNYNGGKGSVSSKTVAVGDDIGVLPSASRTESGKTWRFFGWFTAKEGGAEVTPSSVFGADTTVYARWGIGELNELLGEDSVAFLYENTAWKETTAAKYLYDGKRTLRTYGVTEDGVKGLLKGMKATLVALPTRSCKLKFAFSSLSTAEKNNDLFYAETDDGITQLMRFGKDAVWETAEFCVTNAVRLTLEKGSESSGLNAQASVSDFSVGGLDVKPELADWDSAAASGLADDFTLYGNVAWKISSADADRFDGVNGLVVDGLPSNSCSTAAFKAPRAGRVSFRWRTSCEREYWEDGVPKYTDRLELRTNGVAVTAIGGIMTEYETFAVEVPAGCEVSWRYVKDADGVGGADKAWLDAFAFESTGEYAVVFKSEAQADRTRSYAFSKVYSLPGPSELGFTAPGGKTKFAGWKSGDGRRYDDGVLVFNLSASGEDVEMTAIWE